MSETAREKLIEVRAKCLYEAIYPSFKFENALELDKIWYTDAATADVDWFLSALSSLPDESLELTDEDYRIAVGFSVGNKSQIMNETERKIAKAQLAKLAPKLAALAAQKNEAVRVEREKTAREIFGELDEIWDATLFYELAKTQIKYVKAKYLKAESERK